MRDPRWVVDASVWAGHRTWSGPSSSPGMIRGSRKRPPTDHSPSWRWHEGARDVPDPRSTPRPATSSTPGARVHPRCGARVRSGLQDCDVTECAGQDGGSNVSEVLRDRLELAQRPPRATGRFATALVETMIDVVVNQLFLRRSNGTLDSVQLLRHVEAGAISNNIVITF